jgi:hypothetical protein
MLYYKDYNNLYNLVPLNKLLVVVKGRLIKALLDLGLLINLISK